MKASEKKSLLMEVAKEQARTKQIIADLIVTHLQKKKKWKISPIHKLGFPKKVFISGVHTKNGFICIIPKIVFLRERAYVFNKHRKE